ncbi:hypothetical protein GCM10027515_05940 [Schumannella luteola]|uniref:5'-nucleotidase n=1 Tax=Schumannella luteola TaxID=472059 RepID=A0A852YAG5_9MICO|nr:ExeM/NucH family extracellular endonuclease [Schumannella luteola]NYG98274.1 5'-nucleotidase [Schumannella luteola]
MPSSRAGVLRGAVAAALGAALVASAALTASPALASTDGTGVVINEAYLKGGSANAPFSKKFVELYNSGDSAVNLTGWSLQYRSATGAGAPSANFALDGTIAPKDYFLVQFTGNGTTGADLAGSDQQGGGFNASGTTGTIWLAKTTAALTLPTGSVTGNPQVADLIGYGASNTFEGSVVAVDGANGVPNSLNRDAAHKDTDVNSADITNQGTPTPQKSGTTPTDPGTGTPTDPGTGTPTDPGTGTPTDPGTVTAIKDIQGTTDTSPLAGQTVTTQGVVTATYATGGFNGYTIQTEGTGGDVDLATHKASDAIYIYSASTVGSVKIGDLVQVTGAVSEFKGSTDSRSLTEITVSSAAGLKNLGAATAPVTPAKVGFPATDDQRESLESMLVLPQGDFTVSNTYSTNQYAEIGLASGTTPLITPTEIARPGTAEYTAAVADNAKRGVTLDDGASINFLASGNGGNKDIPLPYLTKDNHISVGAAATFTSPVIFDWRNNTWKFQPTTQLTAAGTAPATFSNVLTPAPKTLNGDLRISSFNVLNYFPTTGDSVAGCNSAYTDRAGNKVTVNSCGDSGPRGAWDAANLKRQQDKIVTAINKLTADVVSLEEIENSVKFGKDRDFALKTLTDALNAAAGTDEWAYVPSPAADKLPALGSQDVIRTAFIYKKASVETVGDSVVLTDSAAFTNARQPLAQGFKVKGASDATAFLAIVNHFKSKGSGSGADADQNDGQGASNASRVAQAKALLQFASDRQSATSIKRVFLLGDFNAYGKEDPIQALVDGGYTDLGPLSGKYSYSFSGQSGSLDHILTNAAGKASVTGTDIWNINSGQSIAYEYSRYNYNATNFYTADQYRASDHDPVIVGLSLKAAPIKLNLLNINDFHGRIDANTVKFAGTIEKLKKDAGESNTLFLSDGDNIGASLFASSSQQDQPTIDVLNALGLTASAVGNHEFDGGFSDLTDRVIGKDTKNAKWDYLGANVYKKGTKTPALQEYSIQTVNGLKVAIVGAVTQETPALVTPTGIKDLDFGDPVEAVNRVATQLTDGDAANGEADVVIAEYHEGAGFGTPDGATIDKEIAAGGAFADIVTKTSPKVAAIFTGHTHKQYAWDAPITGQPGKTRPVLQTGSYGENIGQTVLTIDPDTKSVTTYSVGNVARVTTADADLVNAYPRVAQVKTIVDAALAKAAEIGNQPVGAATAPITTAYIAAARDDRGSESTLGNLVADSLVSSLKSADRGAATIGVVNPGGLRADFTKAGTITYADANAVLPFVNNLWTTTLTGAQFKAALEQQWQTNADGTVPSRSFLKLGLSKNVSYTYDPNAARGSHITSITIDGKAYDPAANYRIGSFSFLLAGGDNFREFANGKDTKDSGLIDRDAWIDYLKANNPVSPDFARRSAAVTGLPAGSLQQGAKLPLTVSSLDLTSLGSPANTSLEISFAGSKDAVQTATVANGAATPTVTVPKDVTGASTLTIVAKPSGTTITIPVTVEKTVVPPVKLNLLNINDFHGRIDANTVKFAGTIEKLKAEAGAGNSLFLSDGDNIGASLFASASQQDQPTIDVLNALGLQASAVGNHEFDQGYADLTGRVKNAAKWDYLGANVYEKGTTTPALPEYKVIEVNGLKVAVIGAVTQETGTLVSPAGIEGLEFGDPVDAVNRVATKLTDGDLSNGEADVLIAEYHEGAGFGTPEGATIEKEIASGGAFAKIVTATSPKVAAIFTGHTHKQYAWDAPITGQAGKTRPVLQTGSYGENIGQTVLTIDPESKSVLSYTTANVARVTTDDAALVSAYPAVADVKKIVDKALADAKVIGSQVIGKTTAPITTAFSGGARDDRASESTLGNLVADSLVASLKSADRGGAEIGVVNPGGLRADLPAGDVTYEQANAVLPFVNNLWTTSLTGAQFKTVLEEQWQTNADGTVPSRPFLKLGLSKNVAYTYDPNAARGSHITSITVNGKAIDPAATYRIGTFSFLTSGGDNFRTLALGSAARDSGLVDRDAWIDYLTANKPVSPDFARRSAVLTGTPTGEQEQGSQFTVNVAQLDLTSQGSPVNTELTATWAGSTAAPQTFPVSAGAATATITVPKDVFGAQFVTLTATESGTKVLVPVTVKQAVVIPPTDPTEPTTPPVGADDSKLTIDLQGKITIDITSAKPGATIKIYVGIEFAGTWVSAWLHSTPVALGGWQQVAPDGTISVTIPTDAPAGDHRIAVQDAQGNVLGWTAFTVLAAADPGTPGAGNGGTGSTGSGSSNATASGSRGLAATGVDATAGMIGALALLLAGAALVVIRRRRAAVER